jgi:ferrous iron transport protein A
MVEKRMVPLDQMNEGECGEIVKIAAAECCRRGAGRGGKKRRFFGCVEDDSVRITDLGLRIGKQVELLRKGKQGPLLVKIDDSRIAIGRRMAEKIFIENS